MDTGNTKHRLLLVDGDPKSLRVLGVSLRKAGFAVVTATSGREALSALETEVPSLIISDTDLDEIDGFELCRQIKAKPEWAKIPFLFVSGRKSIEDKIRGLELGVDDYLTKPIYIKEIGIRVRTALQRVQRERLESRREGRTKFAGDLSDIGVVDLVQTIDVNRKSGIVHIVNRDGRRGAIFFRDGNVIDAEVGHLAGVDAMYRLFSWSDGRFEVEFKPIRRKDVIDMPSAGLLMEGMRRLDEWTRLLESLPPLSAVPEVDVPVLAEQLGDLPDEMNGVLRLCDGNRTLLAVVDDSDIPDLEALTLISRLFADKILFTRDPDPAAQEAEDPTVEAWLGEGEGDSAEVTGAAPHVPTEQNELARLGGTARPTGRTLPPPPPWLTPPQEGPTPRVTLRAGFPQLGADGATDPDRVATPQVMPLEGAAPEQRVVRTEAAAGEPATRRTPVNSGTLIGFALEREPPLAEAPWPLANDSTSPRDSSTGVPEDVPSPEERITSEYGSRRPTSDVENSRRPTIEAVSSVEPAPEPPLTSGAGGESSPAEADSERAAAAGTVAGRDPSERISSDETGGPSNEASTRVSADGDQTAESPSGSRILFRRLALGTLALGLVGLAALAPRWMGARGAAARVTPAADAQSSAPPALPVAREEAPTPDAGMAAAILPDTRPAETSSPHQACLKADAGGKGRPKAVLAACRPAVKAEPESSELLLIMARVEFERGKVVEARDWANKVIAVDPDQADAYVYLGGAEQELGNKADARAAYQKYLQLAPSGHYARELRAVLDNL